MQQVELDIATAAHQLVLAIGDGPALMQMAAGDGGIDFGEGLADGAGESEIGFEIAGVDVVVEYAPDAARLVAMREVEVFVAPFLEARIVAGIAAVAGRSKGRKSRLHRYQAERAGHEEGACIHR